MLATTLADKYFSPVLLYETIFWVNTHTLNFFEYFSIFLAMHLFYGMFFVVSSFKHKYLPLNVLQLCSTLFFNSIQKQGWWHWVTQYGCHDALWEIMVIDMEEVVYLKWN